MQYALSNGAGSSGLIHFIASQTEQRYGDRTISAMVAPLFTEQRKATIALRQLVNRGAELYTSGNFSESWSAYTEAAELARNTGSVFDRLWVDLNKVDTDI